MEKILRKAIQKAVSNGYVISKEMIEYYIKDKMFWKGIIFNHNFAKAFFAKDDEVYYELLCPKCKSSYNYQEDEKIRKELNINYCSGCGKKLVKKEVCRRPIWKHMLSLMVTTEEPLKFLERFIKE
jgi:hypothetical protein